MAYRLGFLNDRPLVWTTFLSLMIHLFTLSVLSQWVSIHRLRVFPRKPETPERRLFFEIVETGEESTLPPDETPLYSDRISRVRDGDPSRSGDLFPLSQPVSSLSHGGDMHVRPPESAHSSEEGVPPESDAMAYRSITAPIDRSFFRRERLLSEKGTSLAGSVSQRETNSGVEEFGAFSLNTYAWDYAPYLLELKRRIEKNIFPPPVFTRMGSGGQNVFRFRILPDGSLDGPILLRAEGEPALITTSENAIKFSTPFKPLPKDFPEPFLEITARFEYVMVRP